MRVAVVTLMGHANLGNRLQNYAVQKILENRGYEVTSIYTATKTCSICSVHGLIERAHGLLLRSGVRNSRLYARSLGKGEQEVLGLEFTRKYIRTSRKYVLSFMNHRMEKCAEDFDYWCVGSDQVWNGNLVQNNPEWFLTFAPSKRTFSLSASCGNANIAEKYLDNFIAGTRHLGNISVREREGQSLIRRLAGREAWLLLDPTLFLNRDEWEQIEKKPELSVVSGKYILTYFLSAMTPTQREYIEKYAADNGLEIVEVQQNRAQIGPCEFVWLIHNAAFVFTDSFHGCAFSTIFQKRFLAFNRNKGFDMSDRITTLLDTCGLNSSFVRTIDAEYPAFMDRVQGICDADLSAIEGILKEQKKRLDDYLTMVFA